MKNLVYLILATCLFSCTSEGDQSAVNKPGSKKENKNVVSIKFGNPTKLDSSTYVIYPLILSDEDGETDSYSSDNRSTTYWNMAFYNTLNGEYHLLTENKKMIIYQYEQKAANASSSSNIDANAGYNQTNKLIFYTVRSLDFNNDGHFDYSDPIYLFISDKEGRNFKQISPSNANVDEWQAIKETNKILMMVSTDSNNDKKFDDKDVVVPMVYDLNTNTIAKEIFNRDFKSKIEKQLNDKWVEKK